MWGARYPPPDFITYCICINGHRPGDRRDRRLSGSLPRGPRENRSRCGVAEKGGYLIEKIESRAKSHTPRFDGARRRSAFRHSAGAPYGFTHLPLAFDDLTAASTNARPLTPSSIVGKCADLSGFLPTRAALMASATSE